MRCWDWQGPARCSPPLQTWCGVSLTGQVDSPGWAGVGEADSSSVFRGSEVNRTDDSLTPTHAFLVICLEQKK